MTTPPSTEEEVVRLLRSVVERREKGPLSFENHVTWCSDAYFACVSALRALTAAPVEPVSEEFKKRYDELISAVRSKYLGQTQHETALMYIKLAERPLPVAPIQPPKQHCSNCGIEFLADGAPVDRRLTAACAWCGFELYGWNEVDHETNCALMRDHVKIAHTPKSAAPSDSEAMAALRELVWCDDAKTCLRTSPGYFELVITDELKRREPAALAAARALLASPIAPPTEQKAGPAPEQDRHLGRANTTEAGWQGPDAARRDAQVPAGLAGVTELTSRIRELEAALRPFSDKHEAKADAIGDSDLDNEQPRSVDVTLGDFRRARRALNMRPTEQKEGKL